MTLDEIITQPKKLLHLNVASVVVDLFLKEALHTCGNNRARLFTQILAERYGLLDESNPE
jgi:hypothetical protein